MNNGQVIRTIQGSRKDFVGAWVMRLMTPIFGAAIIYLCKLILAAVLYLVNTLPPMQADVNALKHDVADLKVAQLSAQKDLKTAADTARQELSDAEMRVKREFTRQLNEQLKKKGRVTTPGAHDPN